MTPGSDESALVLTRDTEARVPFYFIKLGDGAIECVNGYGKGTCDGEKYTPALAAELTRALKTLGMHHRLYVGDWMTAAFESHTERTRYAAEYGKLMSHVTVHRWLSFDCLLLMRESAELLGFYRSVRNDARRKLLLGPSAWEPVARLLECNFLGLPVMHNLLDLVPQITDELIRQDFDVLLYGAGLAGHVSVIDCWTKHPDRTYVNVGSAFDPATARGRSRTQQISTHRAKAFLDKVLV